MVVLLYARVSEFRSSASASLYSSAAAGQRPRHMISMAPKPPLLAILLLCLSALFIFSLYTFSIPPPLPPPPLFTTSSHFLSPPTANFSLTIKVLAYDRLSSLSRCLRSLSAAHYGGDAVNLHIFVDHFKQPNISDLGPGSVDEKLESSRLILDFVDGFSWNFGEKLVHYRNLNVGLQAQWLEAWWPSSDDDFVFVVEDDLEVSPLYYKFLKGLIINYYYNKSNFSPWIYGASLQRPRFVPGKHGNKMKLDGKTRLFLYQLVGTWGQLLFPKPWKEFRMWYDMHKAKGIKPYLGGMVTTGWYKKMGEKIWTPWFIKFIHSRGYFNIYTNFLHERALSVSHRDAGVNYGRTVGPDSYLLDESCLDFNLLDMQPLVNLKWYDFCFKEVVPGRVVNKLEQVHHIVSSMQKEKPMLLVSISKTTHEAVTRNLLCHLEGLDVRNYILVGSTSDLLLDLARRGHPTVDAGQLFEDIKLFSGLSIRTPDGELQLLVKEIAAMGYIVSKFLESGFDSWVVNGNMLAVTPSNPRLDFADPAHDFYISKASGFFFARSTPSTVKMWDGDFLLQVARTAGFLTHSQESQPLKDHPNNFFIVVSMVLLEKRDAKLKNVDDSGSILQLQSVKNTSKQSIGEMKKMIFWSSETSLQFIHESLEELGLWIVDGDASCRDVVCHKSIDS